MLEDRLEFAGRSFGGPTGGSRPLGGAAQLIAPPAS